MTSAAGSPGRSASPSSGVSLRDALIAIGVLIAAAGARRTRGALDVTGERGRRRGPRRGRRLHRHRSRRVAPAPAQRDGPADGGDRGRAVGGGMQDDEIAVLRHVGRAARLVAPRAAAAPAAGLPVRPVGRAALARSRSPPHTSWPWCPRSSRTWSDRVRSQRRSAGSRRPSASRRWWPRSSWPAGGSPATLTGDAPAAAPRSSGTAASPSPSSASASRSRTADPSDAVLDVVLVVQVALISGIPSPSSSRSPWAPSAGPARWRRSPAASPRPPPSPGCSTT